MSKSAEQTCVHFGFYSYLWQVRDSSCCFNGGVCVSSEILTPCWLFSVLDSRSQRRAAGLRVHLSPWNPPSPGSEMEERGWIRIMPRLLLLHGYFVSVRTWRVVVNKNRPCKCRSPLHQRAALQGRCFSEPVEPEGRRCSHRHHCRPADNDTFTTMASNICKSSCFKFSAA